MTGRYIVKHGRFGAYFYDTEVNKDVDLRETMDKLNAYDNLHKRQNKHIMEFLADLKEIRGLFNIIKNHKSYNGIIEKWEKRHE